MSFRVMKKTGSIKPRQVGEISVNEWLQAVYASQSTKEEQPPPGGVTVAQFMQMFDPPVHRTTALAKLNTLVSAGRAKRVKCRRLCGAAGIKIVPYYILTK